MFRLRPFQREAVDRTHEIFSRGRSALLVMATGLGKTPSAATLAFERQAEGRTLFLCHRDELVWQAVRAFRRTFERDPDVQMGDERGDMYTATSPVVVSTVQTQYSGYAGRGRMSIFDPLEFGTLVLDEAHHYVAPAYRRVVEYYTSRNPRLRVAGLTATPDRSDKLAMGRIFADVACNFDIRFGVDHSWLVPVDQYTGRLTDLDLSDVGESRGDLNADQLSDVMCRRGNLYGVAEKAVERVGDRRTLIFATPGGGEASDGQKIKHAQLLTAILNKRVPPKNGIAQAFYIHEKTPKVDRRAMLAAYGRGAFQFLVNVGIATEGFDDPGVECVVVARPTMSRALYTQMAGRATRPIAQCVDPYPSDDEREHRRESIAESAKPCCELIDFEGNAGRHKLISSVDILGGDYDSEVIRRAKAATVDAPAVADVRDLLEQAARAIEREKQAEADKLAELRFTAGVLWEQVDPYGRNGSSNAPAKPKTATAATGAKAGPPSATQIAFLQKHAKDVDPAALTMGEAGRIVGDVKRRFRLGLCSRKQSELLARYNLPPEVDRSTAKHWIDRLSQNKWRVPPDVKSQAAATLATRTH